MAKNYLQMCVDSFERLFKDKYGYACDHYVIEKSCEDMRKRQVSISDIHAYFQE